MKLTKAIEILELNLKEAGKKMPPDCKDAVQLGIEAMGALHCHREVWGYSEFKLLPGETEE